MDGHIFRHLPRLHRTVLHAGRKQDDSLKMLRQAGHLILNKFLALAVRVCFCEQNQTVPQKNPSFLSGYLSSAAPLPAPQMFQSLSPGKSPRVKSRTTSDARISPATDGTKARLPGVSRLVLSSCVPGTSSRRAGSSREYTTLRRATPDVYKRQVFDVAASLLILIVTSPFFLLLALALPLASRGPVFYRPVRVGRYDKAFRIFKFRTMVQNADKLGLSLTVGDDPRLTRVGRLIRK